MIRARRETRDDAPLGALPPRISKPSDIRPLGPVDIAPLESILERLTEEVWIMEDGNKPNKFACFEHTRHVIFRFVHTLESVRFYSNPSWKIWSRSLLPVMEQASAALGLAEPVFPKAMLASLAAGHRISLHRDGRDGEDYQSCVHKIHVPIRTEPDAVFLCNGVERHLRRGHAYEVNNIARHGAFNGGREDRVHFIFETFDDRRAR